MRLTIKGKTRRHKDVAHMANSAEWCSWNSPTSMALQFANGDNTTGDVSVVMSKQEAITLAIDLLKMAATIKDSDPKGAT